MRAYTSHYRADAQFIVGPSSLSPTRQASEARRLREIVRQLRLRPQELVVDLGCGSGWRAELCTRERARVVACDVAPAGVGAARTRYPQVGNFAVADAYAAGIKSRVADVVVMSEVLEHLEDLPTALGELKRLLRPGGRALITVPNNETIVHHLCIHCNRPTPVNAHLHSFTAEDLGTMLRRHGLAVRSSALLSNRLLELVGFPHKSRWFPQWAWTGCATHSSAGQASYCCWP